MWLKHKRISIKFILASNVYFWYIMAIRIPFVRGRRNVDLALGAILARAGPICTK